MTIGRRLYDMARGELNALLDKAARLGEGANDDDKSNDDPDGLNAFSEAELEAELARRRDKSSPPPPRPRTQERTQEPARPVAPDKFAHAYAALELAPGADFATVKRQYRNLMRKYHPDHHASSPHKEKAAHELTQKLTEAYKLLEQKTRPR